MTPTLKTPPENLNIKALWKTFTKRRWVFLAPLFLFGIAGFIVANLWPPRYKSEAEVLVAAQMVPEKFVSSNVVSNVEDRLQNMSQQILSRTRLQKLILQYSLYPG